MSRKARPASHRSGAHSTQPHGEQLPLDLALEALELRGHERVLDVGCSSHHVAQRLARRTREVISLESSPERALARAEGLAAAGHHNVRVESGPFDRGFAEAAPYQLIIVSGGATTLPPLLIDQLAPSGHLVIPLGDASGQVVELIERHEGGLISRALGTCHLPLLGASSSPRSSFPWAG